MYPLKSRDVIKNKIRYKVIQNIQKHFNETLDRSMQT